MFYLPSVIWKTIASDSGTYMNKMLEECQRSKVIDSANLKKIKDEQEKKNLKDDQKEQNEQSSSVTNKKMMEENQNQTPNPSLENSECHSLLISNEFSDSIKKSFNRTMHKRRRSLTPSRADQLQSSYSLSNNNKQKSAQHTPLKLKLKSKFKVLIKPISGVENLTSYYLFFKILNFSNVLLQLAALAWLFGPEFFRYGIDFFKNFLENKDPVSFSKQFPIMTICDYYVHQNLKQLHFYSVQCLLVINFLIEKFFVVIWFWLFVLLVLTFFNILSWIYEIYMPGNQIRFLTKYLNIKSKMVHRPSRCESNEHKSSCDTASIEEGQVKSFYKDNLGKDGFVMLYILKKVAGDLVFIELLNEFWIDFQKNKNS